MQRSKSAEVHTRRESTAFCFKEWSKSSFSFGTMAMVLNLVPVASIPFTCESLNAFGDTLLTIFCSHDCRWSSSLGS